MKPPDVIYLQWHGDAPATYLDDDDNEVPIPDDELDVDVDEVTWCVDRIYDADIPYRRVTTCVWRYEYDQIDDAATGGCYRPTTHGGGVFPIEWTYCPFCGGRIRVEGA